MDKKIRVLAVDDENSFIDLVKHHLEHTGKFEVTAYYDPRDFLKMAETEAFDIYLLDEIMPYYDGNELYTKLRADEKSRNTPVIFLSTLYSENDYFGDWKELDMGGDSALALCKTTAVRALIPAIDHALQGGVS